MKEIFSHVLQLFNYLQCVARQKRTSHAKPSRAKPGAFRALIFVSLVKHVKHLPNGSSFYLYPTPPPCSLYICASYANVNCSHISFISFHLVLAQSLSGRDRAATWSIKPSKRAVPSRMPHTTHWHTCVWKAAQLWAVLCKIRTVLSTPSPVKRQRIIGHSLEQQEGEQKREQKEEEEGERGRGSDRGSSCFSIYDL